MFTIHATKKLLARVRAPVQEPVADPSTSLRNWYATALFWRPQVALFVNEPTLLPVLVPLAPARDVARRLPDQFARVMDRIGVDLKFVDAERIAMSEYSFARTTNRSVVGSMNEFAFLAGVFAEDDAITNLVDLSARLAGTPCGPLRGSDRFPDRAVHAVADRTLG